MKTIVHGYPAVSWILRVLLILTILFFALFSLDVFDEQSGFRDIALGLLIHNIPSLVMLVILLLAWKWEHIGGATLILATVAFGLFFFIRSGRMMYSTLIVLSIPVVIGILFLLNYYFFGRKKVSAESAV